MPGEFALIDRYFGLRSGAPAGARVPVGIGDDCAAIRVSPNHLLLTSVDTFSEGVHFFSGTDPRAVGHKSLAVNLSDLAACGARPVACVMALSLPSGFSEDWVRLFAEGFLALSGSTACPLIGGDTTRSSPGGGISITVTVFGECPDDGSMLRRNGARAGDDLWLSGPVGAAALGVALRKADAGDAALAVLDETARQAAVRALDWPQPRLGLGMALRGIASACIDVSDGLLADMSHVLKASGGLGACLDLDDLPFATALAGLDGTLRQRFALSGGDDYELCFTAPAPCRDTVLACGASAGLALVRFGRIEADAGIRFVSHGQAVRVGLENRGYEHF